jgi:hypothetical protein
VETTAGSRARMRERTSATVKIDSKVFDVMDMSESGLVLDPYSGDLVAKQRFYFDLILPINDKEQVFRAEAMVIKVEGTRLVGKFIDLRRDAQRAIQYILAHRNAVIAGVARAG